MFIEELQKLWVKREEKGLGTDSVYLCRACTKLITEEVRTREYTSRGRPGHRFAVNKLFGKPIVHDIEIKGVNGELVKYEKCLKHGLKRLDEETITNEDVL